ncbi:sensor histidine kinase [Mucilaginibacter xinganensis]|nr:histidine kinase [Mucilaginibacter xinganensis]
MLKRLKPAVIIEFFIHLLFWAFITITPIISRPYPASARHPFFEPQHFVVLNLVLAIQFYLNAFVLIPVVLNKNKNIGLYFGLLLLSFTLLDLVIIYTRPHFPLPPQFAGAPHRPPFDFNLFPLAAITAASFAYRYLADQFKIINNKRDITNAALVSELAFLRSQISPHFIFNVINGVVALSRLNPSAVEPTLIQLSKLMRYMLYITDEEKVTLLQKEDYLRSYIELQQFRFRDVVRLNAEFAIADPQQTIEPMLLIPFVENAFKHGTGDVQQPVIDLTLRTTKESLSFMVSNSYNPAEENKDESHGIGLNNVKRRLELLYPGKHSLIIDKTTNTYKVTLKLQFK